MSYIAAANWKMNGLEADLEAFAAITPKDTSVILCPPATMIAPCRSALPDHIALGGQNCHEAATGAHTGEISPQMLRAAGCEYVILGHSERRLDQNESSVFIARKVQNAWEAGLIAILCVGETQSERDTGATIKILQEQLSLSLPDGAHFDNTLIAYEPVWAIGTGRIPTSNQIEEAHHEIDRHLQNTRGVSLRILYGGSMKPSNAAEIIAIKGVHGGLIGGASLKASDFAQIIRAFDEEARANQIA